MGKSRADATYAYQGGTRLPTHRGDGLRACSEDSKLAAPLLWPHLRMLCSTGGRAGSPGVVRYRRAANEGKGRRGQVGGRFASQTSVRRWFGQVSAGRQRKGRQKDDKGGAV